MAAIIVPKLLPLSKIPDTYNVETTYSEDIPEGKTPAQYGIELALRKAENAPGIAAFFKEGIENVFEMWFGTLPVILAIGTVAGTSVTQLIYMSEIGSIIMGSKIPVSLTNLFIIFVERTIVTLPIVAILAHLLF